MKPYGSIAEYAEERKRDLLKAYMAYIRQVKFIDKTEALQTIVNLPADRFYISPKRAYLVVVAIMGGDDLHYMRRNKRDMFFEIYNRTMAIHETEPDRTIANIVEQVISEPAPRYYISAGRAKIIIDAAKKEWNKERMQRMRAWH